MPAAAGAYGETGNAVAFVFGRKLPAVSGNYGYSGVAASPSAGRKLPSASGSYNLTGQASTRVYGRKLASVNGTYALTGKAATLTADINPLRHRYSLVAVKGTYNYSGKNARATIGVEMIVQPDTAAIAAQILVAMSVTPIPANTVQMNGQEVIGSGTTNDPWRNATTAKRPYVKP
jgi:hypothetical protein